MYWGQIFNLEFQFSRLIPPATCHEQYIDAVFATYPDGYHIMIMSMKEQQESKHNLKSASGSKVMFFHVQ